MNEEQNGCKIECDENGCRVECGGQEVEKIEEVRGCQGGACPTGYQPRIADVVRATRYERQEDFEIALAKVAEQEQLNMSQDWKKIIGDMFANNQECLCQVSAKCPCYSGLNAAKKGGACWCQLYLGHNVD